jgi:hypothetical protein
MRHARPFSCLECAGCDGSLDIFAVLCDFATWREKTFTQRRQAAKQRKETQPPVAHLKTLC